MRGGAITAAISQRVPEAAVPFLVVITGLGDPAFLVVLATLTYWLGPRYELLDRHTGATVLATTLLAVSATLFLKYGFAMPRPPADVMLIPEDGAGFPSGHATAAAATYTALAWALNRWSRAWRYATASVLVVVVALSRVVLGVHYAIDVVVGVGVGLVALVIVRWLAREGLSKAFAVSVPIALGGALLAGTAEGALQFGFVAGAALGLWIVRKRSIEAAVPTRNIVGAALAGTAFVGIGFVAPWPLVAGIAGVGAGAVFLAVPGITR